MRWIGVVVIAFACSKADDKKAAGSAAPDPWNTGATAPAAPAAADPWQTAPAPAAPDPVDPQPAPQLAADPTPQPVPDPTPRPSASGGSLAGTYKCQSPTFRNGVVSYIPSTVGTFEISADGSYRSISYPAKGDGTATAGADSVTFSGGAYDRWVGRTGRNASGAYIHIGSNYMAMPTQTVKFSEHICYRQ